MDPLKMYFPIENGCSIAMLVYQRVMGLGDKSQFKLNLRELLLYHYQQTLQGDLKVGAIYSCDSS